MIVHQEQLFVSCTDCEAVFYALGFGGFLPVGPLTAPPPPPPQVLYAAATIIPSLYLFKGLIDSAVWGRWGGGGDRDGYVIVHMLCRLTVIRGGGDTCVQSSQMIHDKYVIIEHVE